MASFIKSEKSAFSLVSGWVDVFASALLIAASVILLIRILGGRLAQAVKVSALSLSLQFRGVAWLSASSVWGSRPQGSM